MFSLNFTTFYLYPSISLSTINLPSIIPIALGASRNKSIFSKYENGVKSFVNFMLSQNELMSTSVAMTQSRQTDGKQVNKAKNWVENSFFQ